MFFCAFKIYIIVTNVILSKYNKNNNIIHIYFIYCVLCI